MMLMKAEHAGRRAWQQTMVSASHCVGLTLPGMMLLPGSFSGRDSSPSPHRGPLPSSRMSFAICSHRVAYAQFGIQPAALSVSRGHSACAMQAAQI